MQKLKEQVSSLIKSRFVIAHFFNPLRYTELLELVVNSSVSPEVIEKISRFLIIKLGKTLVKCNDTPGFIANRIGCYLLEMVVRKAINENLNPIIVDRIFTNLLKLPSTGIFSLYGLIGHDVMRLISKSYPFLSLLEKVTTQLVIGLTINPSRLIEIRETRLNALQVPIDDTNYTDCKIVQEECMQIKLICEQKGWEVIDVSKKIYRRNSCTNNEKIL